MPFLKAEMIESVDSRTCGGSIAPLAMAARLFAHIVKYRVKKNKRGRANAVAAKTSEEGMSSWSRSCKTRKEI